MALGLRPKNIIFTRVGPSTEGKVVPPCGPAGGLLNARAQARTGVQILRGPAVLVAHILRLRIALAFLEASRTAHRVERW